MPDFGALLSKPAGQIERPKPLPVGTYYGTIGGHLFDESRQKKTPFVRFTVNLTEPGEEVARDYAEQLAEVDFTKKKLNSDFYLTEDSMYRLRDFLVSLGIDDANGTRSIGEMIPDALNRPVQVELTQTPSSTDPETVYNNIANIAARAE